MRNTRQMNTVEAEVRKDVWIGVYEEKDAQRCQSGFEAIYNSVQERLRSMEVSRG